MTNEEMAEMIEKSKDYDLTCELWERVKKLLYKKSAKSYKSLRERFVALGVEKDDIMQESYFVFLEALKAYKPPLKFITYLELPFRAMITRLLKKKVNPYTENIDEVRDGDGYSLSETVADENSDIFAISDSRTDSEIVRDEVRKLKDKQRRVIELYYFYEISDRKIAEAFEISCVSVGQLRQRALNELSRSAVLRSLYFQPKNYSRGGFIRPDMYFMREKYNHDLMSHTSKVLMP